MLLDLNFDAKFGILSSLASLSTPFDIIFTF